MEKGIKKNKLRLTPNVLLIMMLMVMLFIISNKIDKVLMLLGQ